MEAEAGRRAGDREDQGAELCRRKNIFKEKEQARRSSELKQEGAHNFFVSFNVDGQQPKTYLLDIYSQMPLFVFPFDPSHYFFCVFVTLLFSQPLFVCF